jgi:CysZ protein
MLNVLQGVHYLLNGFRLILQPGIKRYVVIPFIINLLLFVALFFLLSHFIQAFNVWFLAHLPHWLQWLSTVLWLVFFLSFFITIVYLFVAVGNLVCAPFNSLLAEKIELQLTGSMSEKSNIGLWPQLTQTLARQFAILGYYLPRAVAILLLFFIPLVQTIAGIIWLLFNAWYLTLTYIDYPTDNHQVPLQQVRPWMRQHWGVSLGFGLSVLVVSVIPIINFIAIPAAVAGATQFWLEQQAA